MRITSGQAFDLSKRFRQLSVAFGDYRMAKWDGLTETRRRQIEDAEWDLLALSSVIRTAAVGLVLEESESELQVLQEATDEANDAIQKLDNVRKVINLAASVVGLAGALIARDPRAVASNIQAVINAVTA